MSSFEIVDFEQLQMFKTKIPGKNDKQKRVLPFYEVLGPILTVSQCFSHLPVCGILEKSSDKIYFKWTSLRAIYAMFFILLGTFEVGTMIRKAANDFTIVNVELILFYGFGVIRMAIFFYLATQWKQIMIYWHAKELPFLSYPYTRIKGFSLNFKVRSLGAFFFALFLIEILLFHIMLKLYSDKQMAICNVTSITPLHNFMRIVRPHLLEVLPYHWSIFVLFEWLIAQLSFGWNFVDYFISILSLVLANRFKQINQRLRRLKDEELNNKLWHETRLHFTALVDLLKFIDKKIAGLILTAMSHNLFLLCTKLFEAIRETKKGNLLELIYFYFYPCFLIVRTFILLYSCSSIHEAALEPLWEIRRTPSIFWNSSIKRLSDLIQTENISMSGSELFYITRRLILAMISSIVTFELVLLDRGKRGDEDDSVDDCEIFYQNSSLT